MANDRGGDQTRQRSAHRDAGHDEIVIGRRNEMREVQLDLTPDELVSRVHARAW